MVLSQEVLAAAPVQGGALGWLVWGTLGGFVVGAGLAVLSAWLYFERAQRRELLRLIDAGLIGGSAGLPVSAATAASVVKATSGLGAATGSTPEESMTRMIDEESIARGAAQLQASYREAGHPLSEREARELAEKYLREVVG